MNVYLIIANGWAVAIRHDHKQASRLVKDLKGMGYVAGLLAQKSQESAETLYCWWNYTQQKAAASLPPPFVDHVKG